MTQSTDEARYAQLSQDYQQLKDARIKAESDLEHAEKALKDIQQQAREHYGSDDLNELEEQLETMKRENREMIENYEIHIASIKSNLERIEQEFSQTQTDASS